jgi:hypothetical protein
MIKKVLALYGIIAAFTALVLVLTVTSPIKAATHKGYELPKDAKQISDTLYYLGTKKDPKSGEQVEGYAFIHRKDAEAKPVSGAAGARGATCYGFISKDAKWKNLENWVMNTANNSGLNGASLLSTQSNDITTWENAAAANVLGSGSTTNADLSLGANTLNDVNEVYFDSINNSNTIAVTTVWGIFSGPAANKKLVEWDQVFNTFYQWSLTGEAGKMDFGNISTHELGHALGLGDLYNGACSSQTMYGYASEGETNKLTLEPGDITGINVLY